MKKITLALCACAFALTGLLASCSSGSKDYIDLSETGSNYRYAVNGTIVTTSSSSSEDASKKVTEYKSTTTKKIDGGFVTVSWTENENRESNYDTYSVKGTVKSSATTTNSRTYDSKAQDITTSSSSVGTTRLAFDIIDADGTMYFNYTEYEIVSWKTDYSNYIPSYTVPAGWYAYDVYGNDEAMIAAGPLSTDPNDPLYDINQSDPSYVGGAMWSDQRSGGGYYASKPVYADKLKKTFKMDDIAASEDDDAFDGDFGKEFSINIKIDSKDEGLSYTKENSAKATNASSVEYKLTFVPVEDYDPEDFAEED